MAQNPAHKVYATQQVYTASPAKLVLMCYEQTIISLREAIQAIEQGQIEKRWKANSKAMEIINHLWQTLDMEGGGKISENLDQLFGFILTKLPEVDFKNKPEPALEVIRLLEPIRDAWKELVTKYTEQELAQAQADARAESKSVATAAATPEQPIPATQDLNKTAVSGNVSSSSTPPAGVKNSGHYGKPNMPQPNTNPSGSVFVSA